MSVYIFAGPTIAAEEARAVLNAVYLPPASQGDLYRVARRRPLMIGLIDGLFGTVPSVWHKEILWAMAEGVHVFGSASMGALRAAELSAFGMEGAGAIFAAYAAGELEDDDEVAVAHGNAEHSFRPLSVAMVNIRATLAAARAQGVIGAAAHDALAACAKALFYPERSYQAMMAAASGRGVEPDELGRLEAWLPTGRVDQKRADALAMLALMRERLADLAPKRVNYRLERTIYWEQARQLATPADAAGKGGEEALSVEELLDEARLDAGAYRLARAGAYIRALAAALEEQGVLTVSQGQTAEAVDAFRRARGLMDRQAMTAWLAANDLTAEELMALMRETALARAATGRAAPAYGARIVEQLRLDGAYPRLRARALGKRRALAEAGLEHPSLKELGLSPEGLVGWFEQARGVALPPDLAAYARDAGFRDQHALVRALIREYCFTQLAGGAATSERE
jgi:hypothetical protein